MPSIEDRLNNAAIIKGAAWGTAAQAGAASLGISPNNKGVPKLSLPALDRDEVTGANETGIDTANTSAVDYSLDFDYRFDGLENILLANLMGTAGAPAGAGTSKTHTLVMKDSVSGLFVTYAFDRNDKVYVVPSNKVTKANFSLNGGLIKASFGMRGDNLTDADAVVTALTSVTYPSTINKAKFGNATFRINAQTGGALGAGDVVKPTSFNLSIERKLDSPHAAGSPYIIEPLENGKPQVKLELEFPRMDAVNELWFAAWKAGTEYKADITITGAIIESAIAYSFLAQFPRLQIESFEIPESKLLSVKVTFRAVTATAAPTGMTGLVKPVTITQINTRATDWLA